MGARLQRAWLLYERSKYDLAEKELGMALAQQPDDPQAHALMAQCLLEREQYGQAAVHAQQAVALAPDWAAAHHALARVWLVRNDLAKARAAIDDALRLDPREPGYHAFLSSVFLRQSDWRAALAAADAALALDPEHIHAINFRARALRHLGEKQQSQAELDYALRLAPEDARTHANQGWLSLERGDRRKAMEHFREALRLDPELGWARSGVVETLRAHNPLYRLMLKHFFWMSHLGRRGQWWVVLGAWLGYMAVRRVAAANPALAPWLTPLIVGYVVFALATWFAVPLSNLALRLHPFGKLALSRDERTGSNWIGSFLLAAIVAGVAYWSTDSGWALAGLFFFGFMLLPLGATFVSQSPWPRRGLVIYTLAVAALGLVRTGLIICVLLSDVRTWSPSAASFWLALFRPVDLLFMLGAVLSLWAGNIVMSIRWRK